MNYIIPMPCNETDKDKDKRNVALDFMIATSQKTFVLAMRFWTFLDTCKTSGAPVAF